MKKSMRALMGAGFVVAAVAQAAWAGPARAETAAERGYRILLTVPLEPPALTEKDYFDLWQTWPEPERSQAEKATPAQRQRMTLTRYGFQESPDRAGPVPQQFTSDGKGNLSMNCLACHGGPVMGKVVRGLGNSLIDLATFVEDLGSLAKLRGVVMPPPPPGTPVVAPPPVRGVNNAWGIAIDYLVMRDLDLNMTDAPKFPMPPAEQFDVPMKTPPYWVAAKKSRFYADGFIAKSHRDIMQFTFQRSMSREQIMAQEDNFKDIYAWINSVTPPANPHPVDRALANRGRLVYLRDCSSCHGTYGQGGSYPERLVSLEDVGTDPVRVRDFSEAFTRHLGASWVGEYGKTPLFPKAGGYIAPPLDGIWANAPYLHNASVPTMWHLLTPGARPVIWKRTLDGYDPQKMGLEVTTYDSLPAEAVTPQQKRQYFQTGLRGLGNGGHRYPATDLNDTDKAALIEYLKTL